MATSVSPGRLQISSEKFSPGSVTACLDPSSVSYNVLHHACAIAGATGASATLLSVLECRGLQEEALTDPVAWDLRRLATESALEQMAQTCREVGNQVEREVVEGQPAEQLCRWADDNTSDIIVLGTGGDGCTPDCRRLGSTVRDVIERMPGAVLLIPPSATADANVRYRRILLPLDGSPHAESILGMAMRIADAHDGELLLAHVVPTPELTGSGPAEAEDAELRERLIERNERIARQYLNRVRSKVARNSVDARALLLRDDDVRGRLARLVSEEEVDLVMISARGRSHRSDAPYGSVAAHLMTHVPAPILIVWPPLVRATARIARSLQRGANIRLPGGTMM